MDGCLSRSIVQPAASRYKFNVLSVHKCDSSSLGTCRGGVDLTQSSCGYGWRIGGSCGRESAQVWTVVRLVHIIPVLVVIGQTPSDEFFTGVWDAGLLRKLNLSGIQDGLIPDYRHLRFIVSKWFHTEEELVKNYTNAPYVHLETKWKQRGKWRFKFNT